MEIADRTSYQSIGGLLETQELWTARTSHLWLKWRPIMTFKATELSMGGGKVNKTRFGLPAEAWLRTCN